MLESGMAQPPVINGSLPVDELRAEIYKSVMLYGQALVMVGEDTVVVNRPNPPHTIGGLAEWLKRHPPHSTVTADTPTVSSDGTS